MQNHFKNSNMKVPLSRPFRAILGLILIIGGLFFCLATFAILSGDLGKMPHPDGAVAIAIVLGLMGVGFAFIGIRLLVMKDNERLLGPGSAKVISITTMLIGIGAVISSTIMGVYDGTAGGLFFIGMGYYLHRFFSKKDRPAP